jgi:hypothetical protein
MNSSLDESHSNLDIEDFYYDLDNDRDEKFDDPTTSYYSEENKGEIIGTHRRFLFFSKENKFVGKETCGTRTNGTDYDSADEVTDSDID